MNILLHRAVSFFVFGTFILLACAGVWVAAKYGAVAGYLGFAWLLPLAAALWLAYEFELFGISSLNLPFVYTLLWVSFILSVVCFPLLVATGWDDLSGLSLAGLSLGAFLHGVPLWIYILARNKTPG